MIDCGGLGIRTSMPKLGPSKQLNFERCSKLLSGAASGFPKTTCLGGHSSDVTFMDPAKCFGLMLTLQPKPFGLVWFATQVRHWPCRYGSCTNTPRTPDLLWGFGPSLGAPCLSGPVGSAFAFSVDGFAAQAELRPWSRLSEVQSLNSSES